MLLLLLLSHFSHVWFCATPQTAAHQAPPSLGFSRQEHLEWVAISFSRGSSWPRDQTLFSRIAGRFFTFWATWESQFILENADNIEYNIIHHIARWPQSWSFLLLKQRFSYIHIQLFSSLDSVPWAFLHVIKFFYSIILSGRMLLLLLLSHFSHVQLCATP